MSARERLTEALRNPGLVGYDEEGAAELIDAFAHALAEQIRATDAPDIYVDSFEDGAVWSADLIDPDPERPVGSEEKNA